MEYLIWLVLAVLIGATFWWKSRQTVTKQDWEKNLQSTEYRQDTFLTRTSDKDQFREGTMRANVKSVPVPPPMRDGRGRPIPLSGAPSALSRVDAVGNTASPPQTVGLTANSNITDSSTNMLTTLLVLDAVGVFDSEPAKSEPAKQEDTYTVPSYTPDPPSSSSSSDSGWSNSDKSDSGWSSSGSDSGWSSSDSSSSDSSSSSSGSSDW